MVWSSQDAHENIVVQCDTARTRHGDPEQQHTDRRQEADRHRDLQALRQPQQEPAQQVRPGDGPRDQVAGSPARTWP